MDMCYESEYMCEPQSGVSEYMCEEEQNMEESRKWRRTEHAVVTARGHFVVG